MENVDFKVHLVKGKAESPIPEMARQKQVDLIVMGTVCRFGIAGLFIGPTSDKVLPHVDCSVPTVKPETVIRSVPLPVERAQTGKPDRDSDDYRGDSPHGRKQDS